MSNLSRLRPAVAALACWLGGFAVVSPAAGAQAELKSFDIPAERGDQALTRFVAQSGVEIVFGTATAAEVTTNAVKGSLTPRDAIARLLAGTGLVVVPNEKTGALTVARDPSAPRAAQPTPGDRPNRETAATARLPSDEEMRRAAAANPAGTNGDQAHVLSPFIVSSDRDSGYQALNTLAGTRLNTPIEDIAAAISVYTKDFIRDIGATDLNELMVYATGMDAPGSQGNYSGYELGPGTLGSPMNETPAGSTQTEPQGLIRTRGLANPSRTRDFFLTDIRVDSYNTERITVNRGPNAILFGVGNPAGIVDTALAQADTSRDRNSVDVRFGSHGSLRGVLDLNRVLVQDKLAARLIGLRDRKEFVQRPAFEEDRRLYGAVTYRPFRTTSVRANFETGRTHAKRPFGIVEFNGYDAWDKAGRKPYDWTLYDDPARTPNAAAINANSQVPLEILNVDLSGSWVLAYSNPAGRAPDVFFLDGMPTTTGTAANAVRSGTFHPLVNRDLGTDNVDFYVTGYDGQLAAAWWPGGVRPPAVFRQSLDYSEFDWRRKQINQSDYQNESFNAVSLAIEQRAWRDRVGVELAYNHQRNDRRASLFALSNGQGSNIRIDPNVTLSNGEPNPNLGRPFVVGGNGRYRFAKSEREAVRGSVYLKYDFKELGKSWSRWLGSHTATGLYEHNAANTMLNTVRLATAGPAADAISTTITSAQRRYWPVYYLGPSVIGNNNPVRLEAFRGTQLAAGDTFQVPVFTRAADATDPGRFTMMPVSLVEILDGGTSQRDVIESRAVALQSYWLGGHLVTLGGWRRDEDYFQIAQLAAYRNPADNNDAGKARFGIRDFGFADTPPINAQGEIKSYGVVAKWPRKFLALPLRADLSGFFNASENFTPAGGYVDAFNNPLSSPRGETKEYGFNLSLFDRKLTLRMSRFETAIVGQLLYDGLRRYSHEILLKPVAAWAAEGNRNPNNVPFMQAAIARMLSPLPSNYLALRNFKVEGTAPNIGVSFNDLIASDTTNYAAKGVEFDIIYNPTRNWRILLNLAKQETVQSNVRTGARAFRAMMDSVYTSTITDPVSGVAVKFTDIPLNGYNAGTGPANPPPNANVFGNSLRSEDVALATQLATGGTTNSEQRGWRVNVVSTYEFGRESIFGERLRGVSVGGGARWQGKYITGYPVSVDANGATVIHVDRPYYGEPELNVDAWLGYRRKIWKDKIDWKVRFGATNVIGGTGLKIINVQPSGEHAGLRIPPEKRWSLSNRFDF